MARRTTRKTKQGGSFFGRVIRFIVFSLLAVLFFGTIYHYRAGLAYYLGFKTDKVLDEDEVDKHLSDVRNIRVLENHKGKVVGIDVSEFQGKVDWEEVEILDEKYPVQFVFIRATAGNDRVDRQFKRNWEGAKENKIMRGAYHYYRPNENSIEQADLFIKTVKLQKGDLPPVLDIEKLPKNQSLDSLKKGLKRWLTKVEKHYQVRPIIYSGERYYSDFLKEEFGEYLFWIANYNFYREKIEDDWLFWQFTEKASLPGIKHRVDVNIYNGDIEQLQFITVE
ncbi:MULTISPECIES: glycoside hydrolase family 25 protein [Flavobacterium]|jgi:lysozyme|uniref:Lysozyme n=2 Tax=Flavobacterium johnsoniae TaxID=986 RepID=A0A1M7DGR3_FLAJO|nr:MULTISPECIES: glycoside hydrolase family 25 protein [Flavobacterium]ABQ03322.1 Lysozyme-like protein; Glycoside hydrolase family 25 [Flavobacterium johnsoniae UW101]OXG01258.1 glycoside hydrolase [Flavobacterium johnsoniae UW101]WDF59073.1 glycoside hydrolase family 25 protein [Flavobacterium sp. KACC 22758]WQG79812.1 glycoside hydrolase family 25 protein [Flavobacterium johnsoniae UW101]SHG58166.1 lysozyme [Flavobacterium johnsoniae]